jgi:hypothetical protein
MGHILKGLWFLHSPIESLGKAAGNDTKEREGGSAFCAVVLINESVGPD